MLYDAPRQLVMSSWEGVTVARRYSQIDPWFIQRGYKRVGTRMCYYRLQQGDLLFELSITATPFQSDLTSWRTSITYYA